MKIWLKAHRPKHWKNYGKKLKVHEQPYQYVNFRILPLIISRIQELFYVKSEYLEQLSYCDM